MGKQRNRRKDKGRKKFFRSNAAETKGLKSQKRGDKEGRTRLKDFFRSIDKSKKCFDLNVS